MKLIMLSTALNEQAAPITLLDNLLGIGIGGDLRCHCRREAWKQRAANQALLDSGIGLGEHLAGKKLEQQLLGIELQMLHRNTGPTCLLQCQCQTRCPAVGLVLQRRQGRFGVVTTQTGDGAHFVSGQAQLFPVEPGKRLMQPDRRRCLSADHDQADAAGHFLPGDGQHTVHRRIGSQLVIVVQHQRGRLLHACIQRPEKQPRVSIQVAGELGCQHRQAGCGFGFAGRNRHGLGEVIEEAGRVIVAAIDMQPDAADPALTQIAGHQRGFAGARRPGDPDRALRAALVQPGKQALARQHFVQLGTGQLGKPAHR